MSVWDPGRMSLDPNSPSMKLWHRLLAAGVSEGEATELMNGYAHELAESIRKQTARGNLISPEFEQAWEQGLHCGADLVDPEECDAPPVDEYRLSSRPRVVGGGS